MENLKKIIKKIYLVLLDISNPILEDLSKMFSSIKQSLKEDSNKKHKLQNVLNHFSSLAIKTKVFILLIVLIFPLLFLPFQKSYYQLVIKDEQTLALCMKEALIAGYTRPSKGDTRDKATNLVNLMNAKNNKSSPKNMAKNAYEIIKDSKEKGLQNIMAMQVLGTLNIKDKDFRNNLNAKMMICYTTLNINLKKNENRTVRLPFPNLEDAIENLREFQKNKK
jgi:predicted peroxiredoxin